MSLDIQENLKGPSAVHSNNLYLLFIDIQGPFLNTLQNLKRPTVAHRNSFQLVFINIQWPFLDIRGK